MEETTWVLTSYLVANAVVLPLGGYLSSLMGRKRFYLTCVTIFTVASALCGLAPSLGWLIFFRILQGLGGGGIVRVVHAELFGNAPGNASGAPLLSRRPVGDSCLSNQFYCSEPPDVRDAMYQVPPTFLNVHV